MIPLSPPAGYWNKLHSIVSKLIWSGKQQRVKYSTAQHGKLLCGLSVPSFKLYFWFFIPRPLAKWFEPQVAVCWRALEEKIIFFFQMFPLTIADCGLAQLCAYLFIPGRQLTNSVIFNLQIASSFTNF